MSKAAQTQTAYVTRVSPNRLLWVAPLTIVVAVTANGLIFLAAEALFGVAWAPMFTLPGVMASTAAYLLVAALVWASVARFSKRPSWLYYRIALAALLVSFLMPLSALLGMAAPPGSGLTAAPLDTVLTMLVMHTVAYAVSVSLFTRLTRAA